MAWTGHKIKVYSKLAGFGLIFLAVVIFLIQNRAKVSIKFLVWETPRVPMFLFVLSVATGGVLIYKVSSRIIKVIRDARQLRREDKAQQKLVEQVKSGIQSKEQSQEGVSR